MSAHTPGRRPWSAKLEDRAARDGVDVFDADGDRVLYVSPEDTKEVNGGMIVECLSPEQKVNVAHVLKCVNAHDDLLAACDSIAGLDPKKHPEISGLIADARAAIAKARAGK